MNNKIKYICIFVILPLALIAACVISLMGTSDNNEEDDKSSSSETRFYDSAEIDQMLLAEFQKSQSTRQSVEIATEAPLELTPEDEEYDDMIDNSGADEVDATAVQEADDLSDEEEAIIAAAEQEARSKRGAVNYGGIEIVSGLNQVPIDPSGYTLTLTDAELAAPHPLLLQYDPRWATFPYGMGTMKSSACGPTCFSMVITGLTDISNASPPMVAVYSMNHNHYVKGCGTAHSLFLQGAADFGLYCTTVNIDEAEMKAHIDNGEMLILSCHYGNFTHSGAGHFIVIYGYNENGFMVNDPGSYERSTKYWPFSVIKGDINKIYGLGRAGN